MHFISSFTLLIQCSFLSFILFLNLTFSSFTRLFFINVMLIFLPNILFLNSVFSYLTFHLIVYIINSLFTLSTLDFRT